MQHLDGHDSPPFPSPEARPHPLQIVGTSRLADILGMADRNVTEVNSYHHQAVRPDQLGDGLAVSATAEDGDQVEALEASEPDTWVFGVQNHPERPEFTPPEFDRLWRAFVAAAAERRGG